MPSMPKKITVPIAAAGILFLITAILIVYGIWIVISSTFGELGNSIFAQVFFDPLTYTLIVYGAAGIILPLCLVVAAVKMRSDDIYMSGRWTIISLIVALLAVYSAYSLLSLLSNYILIYGLTGQLGGRSISNFYIQQPATDELFGAALIWIIFLGALSVIGSLAAIFRTRAWTNLDKYLGGHSRSVVSAAVILFFVYIIYSVVSTQLSNNYALNQLNQRIENYGGNLRYLLSNKTTFFSALNVSSETYDAYGDPVGVRQSSTNDTLMLTYGGLYNISHTSSTLSWFFNFNGSTQSKFGMYNWGGYNPMIRGAVLVTVDYLGIPVINQVTGRLLVPTASSDLGSFYQLQAWASSILSTTVSLVALYQDNLFNVVRSKCPHYSPQNSTVSEELLCYSKLPRSSVGSAMAVIGPEGVGTWAGTGILNTTLPAALSPNLEDGWLNLALAVGNVRINQTEAYAMVLPEYSSDFASEMFYNKTIHPNINFIGYSSNELVVDLGNIELNSSAAIRLYVDGNQTDYSRYYNFVESNIPLGIGLHRISATIGNVSLNQNLYVSPAVMEPMGETLNTNGTLTFELNNQYLMQAAYRNYSVNQSGFAQNEFLPTEIGIMPNPYFGNVVMSNISLSSVPPDFEQINTSLYSIFPGNILGTENASVVPTGYIFNKSIIITHVNGTGLLVNYTYVNRTQIDPNGAYLLRSNSSVQLVFNTGYIGAVGEPRIFFFSADTNYGKAYYVISTKSI